MFYGREMIARVDDGDFNYAIPEVVTVYRMTSILVDCLPSLRNRSTQKYSRLYLKPAFRQKNSIMLHKRTFIAPKRRHPLMV